MTNDPNIEATKPQTPSPYESGATVPGTPAQHSSTGTSASEKPVEQPAPDLAATAQTAAADQPVVRHPRSPFDAASPKPEEIWREHENRVRLGLPSASVAEICAEWKCEVPLEFIPPAGGTLS